MIDIEEFRTISKDKLIEVTDYIHSVDISPTEKKKRTLELAITLFMSSVVINTEEIAKRDAEYHMELLKKAVEETIEMHFHGTTPTSCDVITDEKTYEENNDGYRRS